MDLIIPHYHGDDREVLEAILHARYLGREVLAAANRPGIRFSTAKLVLKEFAKSCGRHYSA